MMKNFNYGGQAVIEGVMMRGRKAVVTAVRRPNGALAMDVHTVSSIYNGWIRHTPFLRGIVVLIESMVMGTKSLLYSANVSLEEEDEKLTGGSVWGMILVAMAIAVGLFFIAPLFLTKLANPWLSSSLLFHIVEGLIRLAIFVAYLKVMSLLPDIKRVFTYHGAEHKTVNAYEANVPLEVDAIKKYGTAHVRCGTSFLFIVLVIAIIVFAFVGRQDLWLMITSRVVLIPVIAALGYEVTQFGARHRSNWLIRVILAPGLWLQSLTTGEPTDRQLEVAIAALQKAVELDRTEEAQAPA
ncbi:MAG: DUF1385 domain-containing protein [Dehalococcoidales bacterium]|nr:DUF1385 domain-containing protein [Dehalococcoidales bacterium]